MTRQHVEMQSAPHFTAAPNPRNLHCGACATSNQGGITCGAIDEPRKSSKAIDERVIIIFRDKNVVIAYFRDKNVECLYIYYGVIEDSVICSIDSFSVLSIAFLFYL